jgi:hypothetical protein
MIRTHRSWTTAVLIVCLLSTASSEILFASDDASSARAGLPSLPVDRMTTAKEDVSTITATEFVRTVMGRSPLTLDRDELTARLSGSSARMPGWNNTFTFGQDEPSAFAQRGGRGRGFRGRRNDGAIAAVFIGAAAAIAGTAVLVYANRPECSATPAAGGCGYGTKVFGGAVVSAGVAGLVVGALTWR